MGISKLIEFWAEKTVTTPEGFKIHPKDKEVIADWQKKYRIAFAYGEGHSGALHLRLSPVPYVGNLRTADIFLAMTNPTVGDPDYEDNKKPAFQRMLQANLDQNNVLSCFALDATWPSWSAYYRRLFGRFVRDNARSSDQEREVWSEIGSRLAILELVPYYSKTATDLTQSKLYEKLPSAQVARGALQEIATCRSVEKALIICRWKNGPERWRIADESRYVVAAYRGGLCTESKEKLRSFLNFSRNGPH